MGSSINRNSVYAIAKTENDVRLHIDGENGFKVFNRDCVKYSTSEIGGIRIINSDYVVNEKLFKEKLPSTLKPADEKKLMAMNIIVSNTGTKYRLRYVDINGIESIVDVADIVENKELLGRLYNLTVVQNLDMNEAVYYGREYTRIDNKLYKIEIDSESVPCVTGNRYTQYENNATEEDLVYLAKSKMVKTLGYSIFRDYKDIRLLPANIQAMLLKMYTEKYMKNDEKKTVDYTSKIFGREIKTNAVMKILISLLYVIYNPVIENRSPSKEEEDFLVTKSAGKNGRVHDKWLKDRNSMSAVIVGETFTDTRIYLINSKEGLMIIEDAPNEIKVVSVIRGLHLEFIDRSIRTISENKLNPADYFKNYSIAYDYKTRSLVVNGVNLGEISESFEYMIMNKLMCIGRSTTYKYGVEYMYSYATGEVVEILQNFDKQGLSGGEMVDIRNVYTMEQFTYSEKRLKEVRETFPDMIRSLLYFG